MAGDGAALRRLMVARLAKLACSAIGKLDAVLANRPGRAGRCARVVRACIVGGPHGVRVDCEDCRMTVRLDPIWDAVDLDQKQGIGREYY